MKKINQELIALFDKYGSDRRRALRENKKLSYLYALADLRENLLDWYKFDPEQQALQIGADAGAVTGLLARRLSAVTVLDTSEENLEVVRHRFQAEPELAAKIRYVCADVETYAKKAAERGETYGYVTLIGGVTAADKAGRAAQMAAAKQMLSEQGTLIAAASNWFGVKYMAGAERETGALSRNEMKQLLPGGEFYYPMPDYRTAGEIFSEAYLPKKGDLTGVLSVYDCPQYMLMDMGAALDAACEDGRFPEFANAFLVFWQKNGTPEAKKAAEVNTEVAETEAAEGAVAEVKTAAHTFEENASQNVIYVKYNRTREDRFQIRTEIREKNGKREVWKTALYPEGKAHIQSFEEKYQVLDRQNPSLKLAKPEVKEEGKTAVFPYLEGKTRAELLGETLTTQGPEAAVSAIRDAMDEIYAIRPEERRPFAVTPEFIQVFNALGELDAYRDEKKNKASDAANAAEKQDADTSDKKENGEKAENGNGWASLGAILADESYSASNIDALFENMLVTADGTYAIDYEWVFLFPVPAGFVKYRTLVYFYRRYKSLLGGQTEREFINRFPEYVKADEKLLSLYEAMERGFQEYVHGENQRTYQEDYMVKTKTLADLSHVDGELARAKERLDALRAENSEKDTALRKVQEVQRLTNNHVANLDVIISDLRHENAELGKTLTYLNGHEAIIFKVRRKLGQAFNRCYPKGTIRRKKLGYWKRTILHPGKMMKMYTTEEGKNLIKGDFEIGEEYLQYGKIRLPKVEHPTVSIVIPVYNQIHYTYLCLQSILEHTKDVSYEVIIADDVSTDATEHLSEFAENLVICRNQTNQGFLRNCNQAAKAARGKYVMFLNNDTQVTEGWLSSLVNLIESDPTIGMVGSKLVYPDGRLQEAGGIIWSDGSGWNYGRLDDPDKAEYNYVKDVDYISGAAILLSTALWKQIGGFDERFAPAYCEDSDLAFEVRKAGYRVVYQPKSKVIHFEGISNGTDVNGTGLKRYQVENSEKLKEKWKEEFKNQCVNTGNPNPFRARERSMGKKIIVVIDHYVPTFDKDAGSKTTFQYLKMFLKKGYVVKFIGDNYLHEEPYTSVLEQMGIEVLYGQEYLTGIWDWLVKNGKDIHVAYLNRPHIATKYVDFIKEHTDIKMIYYGHDLHFMREFREYELTGDVKKRQESEYWKSIEFSLFHKVAVSYYPSYVEEEAIHAVDETIPVKAITAYVYEEFLQNLNKDFAKREGLLFVGGFAHPPNADAVLWFAKEVFPKIREQIKVNFYIVGSKVTDEIKALEQPGNGIIVKGFVSEEELAELYRSCRIVVVPLRYGAGVKGKVVEAIYNGAPIVTTSVGSEGIPDVENVLLVKDQPDEFAETVVDLYNDEKRLEDLAEKTQVYIREHFSIDAAWDVIKEDFE